MSKPLNLKGNIYGKLTVLSRSQNNSRGRAMWLCKCECGKEKIISSDNLTQGKTKSCGCAKFESHNKKHGLTKTDIHNKWISMRQRCNDKNHKSYSRYGAIGINVCEEWNNSFEEFAKWSFKNGYKDGLSLDRIDNNQGYYPDNCRWVEWKKQCNNRSSNILIEYNGEIKTLKEWQEILNFDYNLVNERISVYGYSFKDAISLPKHSKRKYIKENLLSKH